jgi:predicted dithiol-disulfide oxidoreductase (DUF899 family)
MNFDQRKKPCASAFPGESPEYRVARDRLLQHEIELRRAMEAVAAARRQLPPGGVVPEDYVFQGPGADATPTDVRLSELFAPGQDSLVIYSFMLPRDPGDGRPGPASGQTALRFADGTCWPHVAGGCHMVRDTKAGIEHAGFQIETCERFPFSPRAVPSTRPAHPRDSPAPLSC